MKSLAISRVQRAYVGYCAIAFGAFLVLMSSTISFVNNTEYGTVTKDLATELGQAPAGSTDLVGNMAYAIKDDAGVFIHLTSGAGLAVTWVMMVAMFMVIISGVVQRSITKAVLPGVIFIVAATMLGDYLGRSDGGFLLADPTATVAVLTLIGGIAAAVYSVGKPAVIPRAPDYMEHSATPHGGAMHHANVGNRSRMDAMRSFERGND